MSPDVRELNSFSVDDSFRPSNATIALSSVHPLIAKLVPMGTATGPAIHPDHEESPFSRLFL